MYFNYFKKFHFVLVQLYGEGLGIRLLTTVVTSSCDLTENRTRVSVKQYMFFLVEPS